MPNRLHRNARPVRPAKLPNIAADFLARTAGGMLDPQLARQPSPEWRRVDADYARPGKLEELRGQISHHAKPEDGYPIVQRHVARLYRSERNPRQPRRRRCLGVDLFGNRDHYPVYRSVVM